MSKLSLEITEHTVRGANPMHTAQLADCYASSYRSRDDARAKLRGVIMDTLAEHAEMVRNDKRLVVMCGNGDVLLVSWRHGNWGYENLRNGSSCIGIKDFPTALRHAQEHAHQSYGGVCQVRIA